MRLDLRVPIAKLSWEVSGARHPVYLTRRRVLVRLDIPEHTASVARKIITVPRVSFVHAKILVCMARAALPNPEVVATFATAIKVM